MKRYQMLFEILHFGKDREKELLENGKRHEAYQIESARDAIVSFFFDHTKKETIELLDKMTFYTILDNGYYKYDAFHWVADDETREMIIGLKRQLTENGNKRRGRNK